MLLDESGSSSAILAMTRLAGAYVEASPSGGSSSSEELLPEDLRLSEDVGRNDVAPSPTDLTGGGNKPVVPCVSNPAETGLGSLAALVGS